MIDQIGLEFEFPLVKQDYTAGDYNDVKHIFDSLAVQGWKRKFDPNTLEFVGVQRETSRGVEVIDTDMGICTLEVALAPVATLDEAVHYWRHFKATVLLPLMREQNLRLLGYGTQPLSSDLSHFVTRKGHYTVFSKILAPDLVDNYFQVFPGICATQLNFQLPKERAIEAVNSLFLLTPLLWSASANDSVAGGQLLPCKSHRYHLYRKFSKKRLEGRFGAPNHLFKSLCDYIAETWEVPIFEIVREGKSLYAKDLGLTTWQYADQGSAEFYTLEGKVLRETLNLSDLKSAIYFSWLDFRLKFTFGACAAHELFHAVRTRDETALYRHIDRVILEVRPIATQNREEEIAWLTFLYLLLNNLDALQAYTKNWSYSEVKTAADAAQLNGLRQILENRTLGDIGLDLISLLPSDDHKKHFNELKKLRTRFAEKRSPSDDVAQIFTTQGMHDLMDYLTITDGTTPRSCHESPQKRTEL